MDINIDPSASKALQEFKLPQIDLGFGRVICPIMVECDYADGMWGELKLIPYEPLKLAPTAKVFHYAQGVFEGMKAYKVGGVGPQLFRPKKNYERFIKSSERMAIPPIPEQIFMKAVETITAYAAPFIPVESGESLYIRPFTVATEENLGIMVSKNYKFVVIASPSGAYFTHDSVPVLIERKASRAVYGGTGDAKTGGNYAASLISAIKAEESGYAMTLWLDALEHKYVEELSGMNFFCMINGALWTPKLTGTILEGITRDSIIVLAKAMGLSVKEEQINIEDLVKAINCNECTEAFACGTAAIVAPIKCLGEIDGTKYQFLHELGPWALKLREKLLAIQEGQEVGPPEWIHEVQLETK